jgi:hypothetical protein
MIVLNAYDLPSSSPYLKSTHLVLTLEKQWHPYGFNVRVPNAPVARALAGEPGAQDWDTHITNDRAAWIESPDAAPSRSMVVAAWWAHSVDHIGDKARRKRAVRRCQLRLPMLLAGLPVWHFFTRRGFEVSPRSACQHVVPLLERVLSCFRGKKYIESNYFESNQSNL